MPSRRRSRPRWQPSDGRRAPRPVHWDAGAGLCRMCGGEVTKPDGTVNRRARWHAPCVQAWKLINDSSLMREHIWRRDRGVCAQCGTASALGWEADHRIPLHRANGDLRCWTPDNVQTLCVPCHGHKSAVEARQRARRRAAARGEGEAPEGRPDASRPGPRALELE